MYQEFLHCIQMSFFGLDFFALTFMIRAVLLELHRNGIPLPLLPMLIVADSVYILSHYWRWNLFVVEGCTIMQLEMLGATMQTLILYTTCTFGWIVLLDFLDAYQEVSIVASFLGLQWNPKHFLMFHYPFCGSWVWIPCYCNMRIFPCMPSITAPFYCSSVEYLL